MAPDEEKAPSKASNRAEVVFRGVTMAFGERTVLKNMSCRFPPGKISVISGGNGMGKSTTLRIIGGLIYPSSGTVLVGGQNVGGLNAKGWRAVRSNIGMMFQRGALLDSTTVFDNIAFPLREHTDLNSEEVTAQVNECLKKVGLKEEDGHLLPSQLSGGMMKRVALARSIIHKPAIVLVDEPFSGLDPITAKRIELLLIEINKTFGMTLIVVSHDAPSTHRMADHTVIILSDITVEGAPSELKDSEDLRIRNLLAEHVDDAILKEEDDIESGVAEVKFDPGSTWA